MKKIILTITAALALSWGAFAQAPEGFKYQAVMRDVNSNILNNQAVGVQLTILQYLPTGTAVYTETFTPSTNGYGLVNLEIGTGTTTDDFTTIDWANGPFFIQTAIDITGGTSYATMGTSQLMSVPYALYAKNSGSSTPGPVGPAGATGANGANGAIGADGADGAPGTNGTNGTNGANGTNGVDGAVGAPGSNGTNGTNGVDGAAGTNGADGDSAYDEWLNQGNVGSEAVFIASLQGTDGTNGTDGVDGAVGAPGSNGTNGTNGTNGIDGAAGTNGADGDSAYDEWLNQGNVGSEAVFIASLQGTDGTNGVDGAIGPDGLTAYEVWLDQGFVGTPLDYLDFITGADGIGTAQNITYNDGNTAGFDPLTGPVGEGYVRMDDGAGGFLPALDITPLMTGGQPAINDLDMDGYQINDLNDPTANQDAVTKIYVDNIEAALLAKMTSDSSYFEAHLTADSTTLANALTSHEAAALALHIADSTAMGDYIAYNNAFNTQDSLDLVNHTAAGLALHIADSTAMGDYIAYNNAFNTQDSLDLVNHITLSDAFNTQDSLDLVNHITASTIARVADSTLLEGKIVANHVEDSTFTVTYADSVVMHGTFTTISVTGPLDDVDVTSKKGIIVTTSTTINSLANGVEGQIINLKALTGVIVSIPQGATGSQPFVHNPGGGVYTVLGGQGVTLMYNTALGGWLVIGK